MKTKKLVGLYRELDAAQAAVNALRAQVNALGVGLGEEVRLTDDMERLVALLLPKLVTPAHPTERLPLADVRRAYLELLAGDEALRRRAVEQGFTGGLRDPVWRALRSALLTTARAVKPQNRIFLCGIKLK